MLEAQSWEKDQEDEDRLVVSLQSVQCRVMYMRLTVLAHSFKEIAYHIATSSSLAQLSISAPENIRVYQRNLLTYGIVIDRRDGSMDRDVRFSVSTHSPRRRAPRQAEGQMHIMNIHASAALLTKQLIDSPRLLAGYNINEHGNHAGLKKSVNSAITHLADDNKRLNVTMQEIYSLIQLQEATLTRLLGDEPADGLPKHISESIQGLIIVGDAIDSRVGSYVRIDTQASSTPALETRLLAAIQYEEAPLGGMIGVITKRVIKTG